MELPTDGSVGIDRFLNRPRDRHGHTRRVACCNFKIEPVYAVSEVQDLNVESMTDSLRGRFAHLVRQRTERDGNNVLGFECDTRQYQSCGPNSQRT